MSADVKPGQMYREDRLDQTPNEKRSNAMSEHGFEPGDLVWHRGLERVGRYGKEVAS